MATPLEVRPLDDDEIDLALLDLIDYAARNGVRAAQLRRLLEERIQILFDDLEDFEVRSLVSQAPGARLH